MTPLEFYLTDSQLSEASGAHRAVSINPQTHTLEDIFDRMTRPGSTITRAEAMAAYEEFMDTILRLVMQGDRVVTPLVHVSSTLRGVFNDSEDTYDPSRHSVHITVSPGPKLRKAAEHISVRKVTRTVPAPRLVTYYDNASDSRNASITPGKGARLTGSHLSFNPDDPNQGIFFIHKDTHKKTRVPVPLLKHQPKELIFMNPALESGTYHLEVRTTPRHNQNRLLKGRLSADLKVP